MRLVSIQYYCLLLTKYCYAYSTIYFQKPLVLTWLPKYHTFAGRAKNRPFNGMLAAGLFSGGTLLALALAALAALAGKALMTAMLAMLLSALAAMRGGGGGGGGGGKTTYEIISKPVVSHEHSHSSEVGLSIHVI